MGGARMSEDPRHGVVDPNLRVHSFQNLYLCSASTFPSSGYSNPTLTVVALAHRLADRLAGR
jgi:choline dehydrogenase-like flavoprotein